MMSDSITQRAYAPAVWRMIIHPPADGAMNMAIDEAISESVAAGSSPPTLRFYAWQPGCLSLGYAQPAGDVLFDALRAHGWDIVRRLTGGRAILHIDELTYSVVAPLSDPHVEGGVVESYRRLSEGLMAGLRQLGADVHAGRADESAHRFDGPVCFEVPSDYEITSRGKKLLGSAQTRRMGVALQHGALPLFGDITRICDALQFKDSAEREETRSRLRSRAVTLEQALGQRADLSQVTQVLVYGFGHALNLTFEKSTLSPAEFARASELREAKYTSPGWTSRH